LAFLRDNCTNALLSLLSVSRSSARSTLRLLACHLASGRYQFSRGLCKRNFVRLLHLCPLQFLDASEEEFSACMSCCVEGFLFIFPFFVMDWLFIIIIVIIIGAFSHSVSNPVGKHLSPQHQRRISAALYAPLHCSDRIHQLHGMSGPAEGVSSKAMVLLFFFFWQFNLSSSFCLFICSFVRLFVCLFA
jgi:hypothetical protein